LCVIPNPEETANPKGVQPGEKPVISFTFTKTVNPDFPIAICRPLDAKLNSAKVWLKDIYIKGDFLNLQNL